MSRNNLKEMFLAVALMAVPIGMIAGCATESFNEAVRYAGNSATMGFFFGLLSSYVDEQVNFAEDEAILPMIAMLGSFWAIPPSYVSSYSVPDAFYKLGGMAFHAL